jgi:von Willebrand factor type A domain
LPQNQGNLNLLRIARLNKSSYIPTDGTEEQLYSAYSRLISLIKNHLSPVTASIFAEPSLLDNSDEIEWYSDLKGQPVALNSLPDKQQQLARKLLQDRLAAVSRLADELPQLVPGSEGLQTLLRQALQYPGDQAVYVVNDQPVITFWGFDNIKPAAAASTANIPKPVAPSPVKAANKGKKLPRLVSFLIWLTLLALLAWLLWYWFSKNPIDWQDYNPIADEYQQLVDAIAAAGEDCSALEEIYRNNALLQRPEKKFSLLKQRLEKNLAVCAAYIQLVDAIRKAQNNCPELSNILNTNQYLQNPQGRFIDLQKQLANDVNLCAEYQMLKSEIEAAADDCPLLNTINDENLYLRNAEGMFIPLKQQFTQLLKACADYQILAEAIKQAEMNCSKLKNLASNSAYLQNPQGKFIGLKKQLDTYLKDCKRKQIENLVNLCPGERPAELAPELAVVFDASGSMALPSDLKKSQRVEQQINQAGLQFAIGAFLGGQAAVERQYRQLIARLSPEKESRMYGAKSAVRQLVKKTPSDMDIGLVVLKKCPSAHKYGFFSPAKRKQFLGEISRLQPAEGTPLGSGLAKAGQMIDGVNKPATIVIISDGKESCQANHCAIARKLAASKPYLTINVVDILGTGAGNCLARATKKGKVYTARNMNDIITMTEKAASTAMPEHCKI